MKYTEIEESQNEVRIAEGDGNAWSVGITRITIQRILKSLSANPGDMLALWMFYAYISRWQDEKYVRATVAYCMKGLSWSEDRVRRARNGLKELKLIEDFKNKNEKGITEGWYVKINHLVEVRNTHPRQKADSGV